MCGLSVPYFSEQLLPKSRIDETWSLAIAFCDCEAPYGLLGADELELLPVIVPAVLPLVPVGFVLVGFVLVGFALGSFDGFSPPLFSSVPRTSTLWFRYFDQSLLLLLDAISASELPLNEPLVPVVPVAASPVVVAADDPLAPIDTSVRMNWLELAAIVPAVLAADPVSVPAVAADEPVPVVPVELPAPLCRHPVTVTFCPRSDCELLLDCAVLCAPRPTAIAAANTVPKKN